MIELLGAIAEKGIESAGNLLISAGEKGIKNLKSAEEWKRIFVDYGQNFIENEDTAEPFFDELSEVLSKTNMKELAKKLKDADGYALKSWLMALLMDLMAKYNIPHEFAASYSERLLYKILPEIRNVEPGKYDQFFQAEWREEQEKRFEELNAKMNNLSNDMRQYLSQDLAICYAGQMDIDLRRQTANPSIGIDFFAVDDENFQEKFEMHLDQELIYVRGKCREETIYCILNELWRLEENRPVYVVKNIDSWEKLREISGENNIYIPWFDTETIIAIENNINIFVLNENMPAYTQDVIELRPRTFDTLLRCLKNAGMDHSEAYALLTDTHGMYIPMKKHIFKGQFLKKPNWVYEISRKAQKVCLLLGQWEETDGDKLIVEYLYGDTYEAFMDEVMPYTTGEDPFLYIIRKNRTIVYSLASTENTWEFIDVSLDDPMWEKFTGVFFEVINESEELFTLSGHERLLAQLNGNKLFWSETIRRGMMRALIMKAFYRKTENCQLEMDRLVCEILEYIQNEKQWHYISEFWTDLCEISPKAVLNRLYHEIDNPTGLLELFENQSQDILFNKNAYIEILWGVEQLLTQNEFVWDALRWLVKLDACNYHYVSNLPKDILNKVFCPWYNFSAIRKPEDKIYAAKIALKTSDNVWKYLCDALSNSGKSILGTLSAPKYRDHMDEKEVTTKDYHMVSVGYFRLLLDRMEFSVERWHDMLLITENLSMSLRKEVFEKLLNELTQMTDYETIKVKDLVRTIIFRHRYYASSSWAMSEDTLLEYEQLLGIIQTDRPEYEFEYLFSKTWEFPLLHPVPYDATNESLKKNEAYAVDLIRTQLEEFQRKGYDLLLLAEICAKESDCTLGEYLAKFWKGGRWNLDTFRLLLTAQPSGTIAIDYLAHVFRADVSQYPYVIEKMIEWGCSDEILAKVYRAEALWTDDVTPLVDAANDNIKSLFWSQPISMKKNAARWAVEESKKYAEFETFILQLYWVQNEIHLKAQEIYTYFDGMEAMRHKPGSHLSEYYLQQLLEILQKEFLNDEEKCLRISRMEIYFSNLIGWDHMKCFNHIITKYPEVFAELVAGIYKKDHDDVECKEKSDQYYRNIYSIYEKAQFCPADDNGVVNEAELRRWVEQFHVLLKENDQDSLFGSLLGRLFSFSPIGKDGYVPCEEVRNVIEDYADEQMIQGYATSVFNQRGVFSPSAGKEEMRIAKEFQEEAEYLKTHYPKTAEIFYRLCHQYEREAERERLEAENGCF